MNAAVVEAAKGLAIEDYHPHLGTPETPLHADPAWAAVRATGTQLWLDTGDIDEIKKLFTAEFSALTTNNTLLNAEIQKGIYDDFVPHAAKVLRAAAPGISEEDLLLEIAFVLNAKHALRLVALFDAHVSVELHTGLAHDVARSVAYGRRYHAICPERFIVKIPFTAAGLLSARQLVQESVRINFTLGFAARQNYLIARFTNPNWVNVFMGRLNAFVSDNHLGSGENVGEKATLATQRALLDLRKRGESQSHLIGASMREGAQVATLAGLDVFTMPPKVAAAYHKTPANALTSHVHDDPPVGFAEGVQEHAIGADTLWEVPDAFKICVESLLAKDATVLSPADIERHFRDADLGGFFPAWSEADIETITKDGKIPKYPAWQEQLTSGKVGLDALLNLAALRSFVTDQAALDQRVKSFL